MESSLKNMILTLLLITLVAGGAVGVVYNLTKDVIEASKMAKTTDAIALVLPEFDNNPAEDTVTVVLHNVPLKVYVGKKSGQDVGYAVESMTRQGYAGDIVMMVGFRADGEVYNIQVLQHNETPGLGSKIADPGNPLILSFQGRNPADMNLAVKKDGGEVDAITASTISSRAYIDAVERAYQAYRSVALGEDAAEEEVDVLSTVLPEYDNSPGDYPEKVEVDGNELNVYTALKGGNVVGYAAEGMTDTGYHGDIELLVGFLPDYTIYEIGIIYQDETQSFGGQIAERDNPLAESFRGKKISEMRLSLAPEGDVDGISSATVTSTAYIRAIESAYHALLKSKGEE